MSDPGPVVYLVDDDESILKALGRVLSSAGYIFECFVRAEEFLENHDPGACGCAVLDLQLEGMGGLEIQERLSSEGIYRPVIFLTGNGDIPTTVRAMKGGAVDFLEKPVGARELLSAVAVAVERDQARRLEGKDRQDTSDRMALLTPRESEVLAHVVAGRLNKQIAADLGTSLKTIKVHRGRMMQKMGARTVADLVRNVTLHAEKDGAPS